jgi:phosphoribosyl-AMP cyclohydrolase
MQIPAEVAVHFAAGTLIAAIAQDVESNEVLMVAWMNEEAFKKTVETKEVTYWSRSRNALWTKGESSGHTQKLVEISYDCDGDALLLKVDQVGAACHMGERSCFYRTVAD